MLKLNSNLLKRCSSLWRLSAEHRADSEAIARWERASRILERWSIDELVDADALLRRVGPGWVEDLLREQGLPSPGPDLLDLRAIIGALAQDGPLKIPANASTEELLLLSNSAARVREEPFWHAYLAALARLEQDMLSAWREGRMSEEAARSVSWLFSALPKLTKVVDLVARRADERRREEEKREWWRARAQKGTVNHG